MQSLLAVLCVVALLTFSGSADAQFNFSPNWGKRSGGGLLSNHLDNGATCEAAQAVRVVAVYHACKRELDVMQECFAKVPAS
ncbi:hypothetical protein BV898_10396 [Hypsibius exemplaris]|uniref:Uncharacterized protein n=1 Tax=Hypsibius exemplaris TaxID=2072580 RepID=A0A1W0WJL2_HYPEX|nr:hypothetical protein BV898_10396 [Hypsibius exemplaris]